MALAILEMTFVFFLEGLVGELTPALLAILDPFPFIDISIIVVITTYALLIAMFNLSIIPFSIWKYVNTLSMDVIVVKLTDIG